MPLNDNATLVVGSANFYTAPVGTAMPASLSVTPASPWETVGHTSLEDIFSVEAEGGEATTLGTIQNKALRTTYSARTESFAVTIQQFDRRSLRLYYGSNAPLLANGTLGVPVNPIPTERAFLVIFVDGANHFGFYAPRAEIFRADNVAIADAESLVGLPLSVKPLIYSTNSWAYALTPLGGIAAVSVTAGTPGTFSPSGADAPANLAAIQAAITSGGVSPSTAWTAGQHVVLDDGTSAYWTSTAWAAGIGS